ncbi:hypothetical protein N658DRAFT_531249 [Parathielavia hyrcaniae]|uniref:Uncharacterized protein n=1 Tax=Parathielavia hyrcaniae TaxID=113614 RepID=A0AAN6SXC1_9PEZI|nr:hypothetical protein N658DRAFT_531249 [Parathielavia hyrcaniae]
MATVRDLLLQSPLPGGTATFHGFSGAGAPSLTHKNWVQPYPEVQLAQVQMNPDFDAINAVFGNEDSFDRHLQDMAVNPPNNTIEWFQSEGDSVRVFYTHISHPIQLAFQTPSGTPFVVQRSESGPLGSTNVSQTVDFTWGHGERCLLLGELKRHRIIDPRRWTGQLPADGNRTC